jgi:hypothetical protein
MKFMVNGRELTQEEIKTEMAAYGHVRAKWELYLDKSNLEMKRVGKMLQLNEDGKLLLNILTELFYDGDLLGDTPERTHFNLGRREAVRFLITLRDQAQKEP